jgi:hypothetical protein
MIKYRILASNYQTKAEIKPVEVEKESASCVWVGGRRTNKVSSYDNYFGTWEEAHAYLITEAEKHVNSARLALERAKGAQGNVKGMKKP